MFVPDSTSIALSRAKSFRPAIDLTSSWPGHFLPPPDSVYREHISCPNARTQEHLSPACGLLGTRCCTREAVPITQRSATRILIHLAKQVCARTHRHTAALIRPIRNTGPQTRRIPFRPIRNNPLRLAEKCFRPIRNRPPKIAEPAFVLSGTLCAIPCCALPSKISLCVTQRNLESFSSHIDRMTKTRRPDFRSIRNTKPLIPLNPFRPIWNNRPLSRTNLMRPIKYSLGLSRTKYRTIRNESSAYRERILGLSGTAPCREGTLSADLALLTGGLTFLTPLTSLTSPAYQSFTLCAGSTQMIFLEEGGQHNTCGSQRNARAYNQRQPHGGRDDP